MACFSVVTSNAQSSIGHLAELRRPAAVWLPASAAKQHSQPCFSSVHRPAAAFTGQATEREHLAAGAARMQQPLLRGRRQGCALRQAAFKVSGQLVTGSPTDTATPYACMLGTGTGLLYVGIVSVHTRSASCGPSHGQHRAEPAGLLRVFL